MCFSAKVRSLLRNRMLHTNVCFRFAAYLQSSSVHEYAYPLLAFMGTALDCSLGLIPSQSYTMLAMVRFSLPGVYHSFRRRCTGFAAHIAVPLLNGGLSTPAVHGFAITGGGCQAAFRCLATVYTPMRVILFSSDSDGNRTRNENRVKA